MFVKARKILLHLTIFSHYPPALNSAYVHNNVHNGHVWATSFTRLCTPDKWPLITEAPS